MKRAQLHCYLEAAELNWATDQQKPGLESQLQYFFWPFKKHIIQIVRYTYIDWFTVLIHSKVATRALTSKYHATF